MFSFDLFRSFIPALNPIGFSSGDFMEACVALMLLAGALLSLPYIQPFGLWLAPKTKTCMAVLALLPVVLRLMLWLHHPAPVPHIADEFSHLLVSDTLSHLRLANASHPFHRFFETFFVLQQPSYSSIYPIGQGISLALGRWIFGLPWAGVVMSTAAFCALCYWMLRGFISPGWALIGGLLAVIQFGPLSLWMNSYWGGSLAAAAGCLVFGSLPRLASRPRVRDAALLGAGFALHLLTRPFESVMLAASVGLFFIPIVAKRPFRATFGALKPAAATAAPVVLALVVILLQNRAVTGNPFTLPYALSQYQYGVPVSLTFQPVPAPHRSLTPQQQNEYEIQSSLHPEGGDTFAAYFGRLAYRVHYYRFFFLPPLYLALVAFLCIPRVPHRIWIVVTLALFSLGSNFFPAFQFHYLAAVTCLFILLSVSGLERISRLTIHGIPAGQEAARWLVILCVTHFLFWFTVHLFETRGLAQVLASYDAWNTIDHQFPGRRSAVTRQLAGAPGKQLVFVRYYPNHPSADEWVWNEAAIDQARTVWARDLGPDDNAKLRQYFPDRAAWLLEPDFRPDPKLSPYIPESRPAQPIPAARAPAAPQTKSPFEEPTPAPPARGKE